MESVYKIEDRLLNELDEIASKMEGGEPISHDCLDDIKDISEYLNNMSTYMAMRNAGYSRDSGMGNSGYSNMGYSNGRGQRRDSMGRFSRDSYPRMSRGRMEEDWGREPYPMY